MTTQEFKAGMRQLAAGVAILTTRCDDRLWGLTATAVTSLSDRPPSVLACVNRNASAHDQIISSGRFCVNILSRGQKDLARRFAGAVPPASRFDSIDFVSTEYGPRFDRSLASLCCRLDRSYPYGNHSVLIGLVDEVHLAEDAAPLVYMRGSFGSVTMDNCL